MAKGVLSGSRKNSPSVQHLKGRLVTLQTQQTLELQSGNAGREGGDEKNRMKPCQQILASTVEGRA